MLEVARTLLSEHQTQLKAPVLFLFNGGEESLLLAAHGFMATSKWATKLGAFINLESTGPGGPAYLFQHTGASDILHLCRLSWIQGHALIQKEERLADRLQWHYINTHLKLCQAEQYQQCVQFAGLIGPCSRAVCCVHQRYDHQDSWIQDTRQGCLLSPPQLSTRQLCCVYM